MKKLELAGIGLVIATGVMAAIAMGQPIIKHGDARQEVLPKPVPYVPTYYALTCSIPLDSDRNPENVTVRNLGPGWARKGQKVYVEFVEQWNGGTANTGLEIILAGGIAPGKSSVLTNKMPQSVRLCKAKRIA